MPHFVAFLFYWVFSLAFFHRLLPVWTSLIPGGLQDTRLFLWNAWWFRHAVDVLNANPYHTPLLFHPLGSSLVSHDYPFWMNIVTYLAQHAGLNLIAASNVWFMLSWVLAGFFSYLLVWEITRQRAPALVAGLYVMTHSYTLARAMQNWGQFNLWGIALFLWLLVRAQRRGGIRTYAAAGAALAWTAACHLYFLIYSGVIWFAWVLRDHVPWRVRWERRASDATISWIFLGLALLAGSVAAWILFLKPGQYIIGSAVISAKTPANALLVMWVSLFGAFVGRVRWRWERRAVPPLPILNHAVLCGTALILLSPFLWGTIHLILEGGYPKQSILWKTHLTGANLFALVMPNPIHALWGPGISQWFFARDMHPHEQASMIGWVCLALVGWSKVWKPENPSPLLPLPLKRGEGGGEGLVRPWSLLAVSATVLSMGTYLHVFQHNTWMPLPFYLWRLLPVLGNVRVPERWMAVGAIAWGVVLALALVALARKKGWPLNRVCLLAGALILLENWPGIPLGAPPRNSPVYEKLRKLPTGGVLPLPLYIGDSSVGAGSAPGTLIWEQLGTQPYHQQPLLGGYLGRISRNLIKKYEEDPFFGRLLDLEEEETTDAKPLSHSDACASMKRFDVSYVLLYKGAMNPEALGFVQKSLPLTPLQLTPDLELYRIHCR